MYVLAQVMGVFAIILWTFSILLKNKKDILLSQVVANAIYGIEYSLLGAFSAASMNFLSFVRLFIYYLFAKKEKEIPKFVLIIFCFLIFILGFLTLDGILSIIPVIITLLYAYSFFQNNLKIARIVYILCALAWVYYNIKVGAIIGIIGNLLEIISGVISLIRYK